MKCSLFFSFCPTAKPYNAEFYFDTPNPVRILKGNNYSYNLQWTQKDPQATERIIGYWLNVRKVKKTFLHRFLCFFFHRFKAVLLFERKQTENLLKKSLGV